MDTNQTPNDSELLGATIEPVKDVVGDPAAAFIRFSRRDDSGNFRVFRQFFTPALRARLQALQAKQ